MITHRSSLLIATLCGAVSFQAQAVDFAKQVFPILNSKCGECHSEKKGKTKGDFAIDRKADIESNIKAGSPDASSLVITVTLPKDDEDVMPPKGKNMLTPAEVKVLKDWIQEGASFDAAGAKPVAAPTTAAPAAGTALTWTNTAGKSLLALFDRLEGDAVVVKTADGTYYTIPLANLSPESQAQAKKAGGQ
jgi:hypothetical protein